MTRCDGTRRFDLAIGIRYALARWPALTRYIYDGRLEIDNNAAERSLRGIALGRKNWLLAGSDQGGHRAASIFSLVETAKALLSLSKGSTALIPRLG